MTGKEVKVQITQMAVSKVLVEHQKVRVCVVAGPDAGVACEVVHRALRVGSSTDNDLVLTDRTVSQRHCTIEPIEGGVRVRDDGSRNGVRIGGLRLYEAVFTKSHRLLVGDTVLAVELLQETVTRERSEVSYFGQMVGGSACMRELFADVCRIAPTDIDLLVLGETGTGRGLVAEAIHAHSPRSCGPLVVFDCDAAASTLAESELFGHECSAFSGAVSAHAGVFEQAHRGTLFLKEIGELPQQLQPKLLRTLEKGTVRRLGSQQFREVDVRVVATTHRNLEAQVARGGFCQDLHHWLAAAQVYVPPLRDRMEDLPLLVEHLLHRAAPSRRREDLPEPVWNAFRTYHWPGNVRELVHAIQGLLVAPDCVLQGARRKLPSESGVQRLEPPQVTIQPLRVARRQATDGFERHYLSRLLKHSQGNVTRAAEQAEVSRQMIQKLMRKHDVGWR